MAVVARSYTGAVATPVVVLALPVTLRSITVNAAAGALLTLFDNASAASGTILYQKTFAAATIGSLAFNADGVKATAGITATVATATCQFTLGVD